MACTLYTLERACNFLACTIHLDQLADPSVSWISRPAFALPSIVWHTMGCIVCPFVVPLSTTGILKEQSLSLSCIKYAGCMLRPHRPHVLSQQLRIHCIVYQTKVAYICTLYCTFYHSSVFGLSAISIQFVYSRPGVVSLCALNRELYTLLRAANPSLPGILECGSHIATLVSGRP